MADDAYSADMQRAIAAAVKGAVKASAPIIASEPKAEAAPAPSDAKLTTQAVATFEPTPQCHIPGVTTPLWGPGWLADPLRLTFEFDDVVAVTDPLPPSMRTAAGEKVVLAPVLRSHGVISGRLEVSLADGSYNVPHNGVSLVLTSTLESLRPAVSNSGRQLLPAGICYPLRSTSLVLLEAGTLRAEQRLAFSIDLDAISPPETFLGTRFWIRHELSAVVARPWYTFPVSTKRSVVLRRDAHGPTSSLPSLSPAADSEDRPQLVQPFAQTCLEAAGLGLCLECTNSCAGGEGGEASLPGGIFEGILSVTGIGVEEGAPQLSALLQRVETLVDGAAVLLPSQRSATHTVDVIEKPLTEGGGTAVSAGRFAVRFSCKPPAPQQTEDQAGPPRATLLPPPLAFTAFANPTAGPEVTGQFSAHYRLRLQARPAAKEGSFETPPRILSEPLPLTIF